MTLGMQSFALVFVLGIGLGWLHFSGLWLTVQRAITVQKPHLFLWASSLGRLSISIAVFYAVVEGSDWVHLLACLGGFLAVRHFLIRCWRPVSA